MKFKSKKDITFKVIILGLNFILIGSAFFQLFTEKLNGIDYLVLSFIVLIVGFFFWMYLGTNYELTKSELVLRGGPFNGKLNVNRITDIVKGKAHWVGIKYAASINGLLIKFDKFGLVFISPESEELFIKKILELNEDIKVTD